MSLEKDANGLVTQYGPRVTTDGIGGSQSVLGDEHVLIYDFTFDNLPVGSGMESAASTPTPGAGNNMIPVIPKNSLITSARWETLVAFAGGTSLAVGLVRATDGSTAIDADGLITDANLPLSGHLDTAGNRVVGTGALVGAMSDATYDGQVAVVATGTFTAGRGKVEIRYFQPTFGNV